MTQTRDNNDLAAGPSDGAGGTDRGRGCYHRLAVGSVVLTPARTVTEGMVTLLTSLCGYTHPMFNDALFVEKSTPFHGQLLPGELTLALLGGLAEQTDIFDDTVIALVGVDAVRFEAPVLARDTIRLVMSVKEKRRSSSGRRGFVTFGWTCLKQDGVVALTAEATLSMRLDGLLAPGAESADSTDH